MMDALRQQASGKKRIPYIDVMKGICIMLIVLFHIDNQFYGDRLNSALQSFRVPMYYFLSGLFFKEYDGFATFARKKINNIIVPYCFFAVLGVVVIFMNNLCREQFDFASAFGLMPRNPLNCNAPLWFLITLFEVNMIFYICRFLDKRWSFVLIVALVAIGYYIGIRKIFMPLYLDIAFVALPFFAMGMAMKRLGLLGQRRVPHALVCVLVLITIVLVYFFADTINLMHRVYPSLLQLYLIPMLSIFSLFLVFGYIDRSVPLVSYWGRYSIVVLGTHLLLIMILRPLVQGYLQSWMLFVVVMLLELPIIAAMIKYLPRYTAQSEFFDSCWKPNF